MTVEPGSLAGLAAEYVGWRLVIAEGEIALGLAIAVLVAPVALMLTQTLLGLLAAPFALYADREPA